MRPWKLDTPPDTQVQVDEEVLTLRAPLVAAHRDPVGGWVFNGPGANHRTRTTLLEAVVHAWPHVAGLNDLPPGATATWSWRHHGWTSEAGCRCGSCNQAVPTDIDHSTWPADLDPEALLSVEKSTLTGQTELTDIVATPGGTALLGPGDHHRTSDQMTHVATANALRRWPHTMQALRALQDARGMRWNPEELNWQEYVLV